MCVCDFCHFDDSFPPHPCSPFTIFTIAYVLLGLRGRNFSQSHQWSFSSKYRLPGFLFHIMSTAPLLCLLSKLTQPTVCCFVKKFKYMIVTPRGLYIDLHWSAKILIVPVYSCLIAADIGIYALYACEILVTFETEKISVSFYILSCCLLFFFFLFFFFFFFLAFFKNAWGCFWGFRAIQRRRQTRDCDSVEKPNNP